MDFGLDFFVLIFNFLFSTWASRGLWVPGSVVVGGSGWRVWAGCLVWRAGLVLGVFVVLVCVLLWVGVGVALCWGFGLNKPREVHASVCLFL